MKAIGWNVEVPKATMYVWAPVPEPYRKLGSLEFSKKLLADAKLAVAPGVGFGQHGDGHVRFALIENEARTRQALRGIKEMFRKDGLL
jgi:alanine-synthesizing transaminase